MRRSSILSSGILMASIVGLVVAGPGDPVPVGLASSDVPATDHSRFERTELGNHPNTVAGGDACTAYQDGTTDQRFEHELAGVSELGGGEIGALAPSAALSPDGTQRVYVMQNPASDLRISDTDGTNDRSLLDLDGTQYSIDSDERPLWYGDRLAFLVIKAGSGLAGAGRLATVDVSTGAFRVIDADMPVALDGFDLSADGSKVVYADASGVFQGSHIWVANADGTGRTEIVNDPKSDAALPPYFPPKSVRDLRWSPDGAMIAYSGRDGISTGNKVPASHELWVVDSDGSDLREIAPDPVNDRGRRAPVWSPDGSRVAFSWTTFTSPSEYGLAVVAVDSGQVTEIAGSGGLAVNQTARPRWSESANALVFNGTLNAPDFADTRYGVFSIPASGGERSLLYETDSQKSELVLGVFPCGAFPTSTFAGLTPARVLDTRSGLGAPQQQLGAGQTLDVAVLGRGGVPETGVDAVVLNVTATNTTAASYLTVAPAGVALPNASNLNWDAGKTVPNAVVVKVGSGGSITIFNAFGETDVLADVVGYFESGPGFTSITPTRLLDTRTGVGAAAAPLGADDEISLQVRGGTIPSSATAIIMNTTATAPTADSYVTVYPSGTARQDTSNLNMRPELTVANLVASRVGDDGAVRLFNAFGSTHLLADAAGYFETGSGYTGIAPTRAYDSRQESQLGSSQTRSVRVRGGDTGVPPQARAVIVNVTVAEPTAASYLTVYPTGVAQPDASNLNYEPGQTVPNLVFAQIGTNGEISLFNDSGATHVIVDIFGWFA